jgi:hypothetical protein
MDTKINAEPPADQRETYEPPSIEDVPLHAEEQLLRGCKTTNGPGARGNPCGVCRFPTPS